MAVMELVARQFACLPFKIYVFYVYGCCLPACVSVYHVHAVSEETREEVVSPGTRVAHML